MIHRTEFEANSTEIDEVLAGFIGFQEQVPPMHSAVHVDGRRLYEYARAGEEVARAPRRIEIAALERISLCGPELGIAVTCSKGTYIRTLAQDIGRRLGCGAHLVGLRRTAVGRFRLRDAACFEELEGGGMEAALSRLLAPEILVAELVRHVATPEEADHFVHGRVFLHTGGEAGDELAVFAREGRFLGVGIRTASQAVAPLRLMATAEAKYPDFA